MTGIEYGVEVPTNNGPSVIACTSEDHAKQLLKLSTGARMVARVTGPWTTPGVVHARELRKSDWQNTLVIGNTSDGFVCDVEVRKGPRHVWLVQARGGTVPEGFALTPGMADLAAVALAQGADLVRKEQESND